MRGVIWLIGLGLLVMGTVLVFGSAVGLFSRSDARMGISLPVGLYAGVALVATGLVISLALIYQLLVEILSIGVGAD
jgi:hypothetical protein